MDRSRVKKCATRASVIVALSGDTMSMYGQPITVNIKRCKWYLPLYRSTTIRTNRFYSGLLRYFNAARKGSEKKKPNSFENILHFIKVRYVFVFAK